LPTVSAQCRHHNQFHPRGGKEGWGVSFRLQKELVAKTVDGTLVETMLLLMMEGYLEALLKIFF
jgi:hypothetical protein